MNNIVTVRERCQWPAAVALLFIDPWGQAHSFCLPGNVLIDGRLDSLVVNYIDYLWMSGANKDWSSLHFFGPCLIMRELHSHDFLINPVSAGLRTGKEEQMGERGGGDLYFSLRLVVTAMIWSNVLPPFALFSLLCFVFCFLFRFGLFSFCLCFLF